jgi:hypothetical protein
MNAVINKIPGGPAREQTNTSPAPPPRYMGFTGQYINGSWRPGKKS